MEIKSKFITFAAQEELASHTMNRQVISHLKKHDIFSDLEIQTNQDHSEGVALLAEQFANEFGMGDYGRVMGLLHDKGKEKLEFQEYIQDVNGLPGHKNYTNEGKNHAYVGGLIAKNLQPRDFPLIGNPIMGHHRGLYDYSELETESTKEIPAEVSIPQRQNLTLPSWFNPSVLQPKDMHHIVRMLYSCLVDADFLDTERFMQPEQFALRKDKNLLIDLLPKLDEFTWVRGTGFLTQSGIVIFVKVLSKWIRYLSLDPHYFCAYLCSGF